jgi:predicted RNA-binding protein with PUA-like domain
MNNSIEYVTMYNREYMRYWLMKSEPSTYSIDTLKETNVGMWDGVRNYQARNFMRTMEVGDRVLFYHSNAPIIGIVGLAEIAKTAYPDPTQFNAKHKYFDSKSKKENPSWVAVDLKFKKKFKQTLSLSVLKNDPFFADMLVTQKGMRLSVQPVAEKHYMHVLEITK